MRNSDIKDPLARAYYEHLSRQQEKARMNTKQYEIVHSKARAKRGLKSWGLFEVVKPGFSRGIAAYHTEAEALAAKAEKEMQS